LAAADIYAVVWSILPYVVCLGFALLPSWALASAISTALMLVIDSWLVISTVFETGSPFLLAGSLVSTLKLILILPVGFLLNSVFRNRCALSGRNV